MRTESEQPRHRIVAQVLHLVDEIDAVATQLNLMPDEVLSMSPLEGERSIKELYALIGLYDRHVYLPAFQTMIDEDQPILREGDDEQLLEGRAWRDEPFSTILEFVKEARTDLVDLLRRLPADMWNRKATAGDDVLTILDVAFAVIQHDAELLRRAALRLHESRLTS